MAIETLVREATRQYAEGAGLEREHTHPAVVHTHDHYHVTHYAAEVEGAVLHRVAWHTHEHNHAILTHSHDYSREDEERHHAREVHVHDHSMPIETLREPSQ